MDLYYQSVRKLQDLATSLCHNSTCRATFIITLTLFFLTWSVKFDPVRLHHLLQKYICPSERQRCALWIKKLCDPVTCGSGLTGRKNRNMHARLLLHMLRKGVLEGPFTHKPEAGSLKTLPTYMVNTALTFSFHLDACLYLDLYKATEHHESVFET